MSSAIAKGPTALSLLITGFTTQIDIDAVVERIRCGMLFSATPDTDTKALHLVFVRPAAAVEFYYICQQEPLIIDGDRLSVEFNVNEQVPVIHPTLAVAIFHGGWTRVLGVCRPSNIPGAYDIKPADFYGLLDCLNGGILRMSKKESSAGEVPLELYTVQYWSVALCMQAKGEVELNRTGKWENCTTLRLADPCGGLKLKAAGDGEQPSRATILREPQENRTAIAEQSVQKTPAGTPPPSGLQFSSPSASSTTITAQSPPEDLMETTSGSERGANKQSAGEIADEHKKTAQNTTATAQAEIGGLTNVNSSIEQTIIKPVATGSVIEGNSPVHHPQGVPQVNDENLANFIRKLEEITINPVAQAGASKLNVVVVSAKTGRAHLEDAKPESLKEGLDTSLENEVPSKREDQKADAMKSEPPGSGEAPAAPRCAASLHQNKITKFFRPSNSLEASEPTPSLGSQATSASAPSIAQEPVPTTTTAAPAAAPPPAMQIKTQTQTEEWSAAITKPSEVTEKQISQPQESAPAPKRKWRGLPTIGRGGLGASKWAK